MPFPYRKGPFKPLDVMLALFLAGCVPTVLMAVISYRILANTLTTRLITDRRTLVLVIGRLVGAETSRPGDVLQYYRNSAQVNDFVQRAPGDPAAAAWLADAFYSHPRLDGMFLTDADGKLIDAMPAPAGTMLGKSFAAEHWIDGARKNPNFAVSGIYPRPQDNRLCVSIATAVKSKDGKILGFLGSELLVQRVGLRVAELSLPEQTIVQVIDQDGKPLFDHNLAPNVDQKPEDPALLKILSDTNEDHFSWNNDLVSSRKVEGANWIVLLRQPIPVAYKPISNLVEKETIIATWLVALYAVGSWMVSWLYRNHLDSSARIERETSFSQTILANMPIGIALLDAHTGTALEANGKFLEMAREFGGAAGNNGEPMAMRDLKNLGIDEAVERVTTTGRPFQTREQAVKDGAQETHFLSVNLMRLQDTRERNHGVLVLMEDVTHDVETRRDLIAANTAKDQFLALLSHELRNPLSPVITMVSELDKMIDTPEARNAVEIIRRNVELEARLIDDLLDITRIAHGKLQLSPESIDAHRAIHRALEICQRDIDAKHLEVRLDLAASSYYVKADPARFQQVLWNLIKNAVKFTPKGSITISSVNNGSGRLIVEVADTGIGITQERLARIFKPFEQGESSITRRFGGLGLGLAISKAMVEAHGGSLKARSTGIDRGAVFTLELGTVDPPTQAEVAARTPTLIGGSLQHKILIVDDHEDTCTGMKMILERRGYRVKAAHDVESALKVAEDFPFELLISDLGLPDASGFDLMKELRRRRGDSIRGVALSGFGMESDIERSMEAGFEVHLIKPVNLERLNEILRMVFPPDSLDSV